MNIKIKAMKFVFANLAELWRDLDSVFFLPLPWASSDSLGSELEAFLAFFPKSDTIFPRRFSPSGINFSPNVK